MCVQTRRARTPPPSALFAESGKVTQYMPRWQPDLQRKVAASSSTLAAGCRSLAREWRPVSLISDPGQSEGPCGGFVRTEAATEINPSGESSGYEEPALL